MSDERKPIATDPLGRQVFMAETAEVDRRRENVEKLLWLVAPFMGWTDLDDVFVSDKTSIGDFGLDDIELQQIQSRLGVTIKADDYLHEIADRMK